MNGIALGAGLLLPWLFGVAALGVAERGRGSLAAPGEVAWIAGAGYLCGAFALTLFMRALAMAGVRFDVFTIGAPLVVATVALGFAAWRRAPVTAAGAVRAALYALVHSPGLTGAARLGWRLLVGWIALRFVLLGLEVFWRPVYPWDAWIQWAGKARVWYELGTMAPFASGDAWLAAGGAVYFDASPGQPPTVPLLQVWSCLALGRWDDALMNGPWWQIALALAFAVYGGLRSLGVAAQGALVATFFVASLPLANVHVALAGTADLPMAAYYTVAALALLRCAATREPRDAALALLMAFACTEIRSPGLAWALTLVPGALAAALPRHGLRIAAIIVGAGVLLVAILAQTEPVVLGHRLRVDLGPAMAASGESYYLLGSWNLLWYGAVAAGLLAWKELASPALAPLSVVVAAGLLLLGVIAGFPDVRAWATVQTNVHRVTLHFAPLVVVFIALAFRAFAMRWAGARAAPVALG